MSAKKQIAKEDIIEAAFGIVKERGMDSLNMREIAARCNCSTQPIYLSFRGMEELKAEVAKRITETFDRFIGDETASGKFPEYKAIGMGYIRFAKEEKELFKFLFMRNRAVEYDWEKNSFEKSTYILMQNYGLYKDGANKLHTEMWVCVHGIATMLATGYLDWDWETVSEMISDVFNGLTGKTGKGEINGN